MRRMSYKLADYLIEKDYSNPVEYSRIVYGTENLKTAGLQFLIIAVTGLVFGDFLLALFFYLGFGVLRLFIGGHHMHAPVKCAAITLFSLLISLFVSEYIYYFGNIYVVNALLITGAFIIYLIYAPVGNHNSSLRKKDKTRLRQQSLLLVIVMYILIVCELILITSYNSYATVMNMGMMFESLTLLPVDID